MGYYKKQELRDRFAAAALTGLLASGKYTLLDLPFSTRKQIADMAVNLGQFMVASADHMAAELDKQT